MSHSFQVYYSVGGLMPIPMTVPYEILAKENFATYGMNKSISTYFGAWLYCWGKGEFHRKDKKRRKEAKKKGIHEARY